ncbi:hypothetical protein EJ05DRAFT_93692 [Pseudovirgaria hyperparasitica]|uniref:Uncharacterized protein n=1 Tax=Pseudovirgaria hyperparasitica TaxID=470096 RepID=A0A6A6W2H4_9PEZI|nr:uncharacterized protein EJ05DRAFT_93692 [Pseudovirgaria hyperparasitica]KAF2756214.1 hypothetical protein EJ05DRAFT_93692 [Pseudovirgaria hyperparasitica]
MAPQPTPPHPIPLHLHHHASTESSQMRCYTVAYLCFWLLSLECPDFCPILFTWIFPSWQNVHMVVVSRANCDSSELTYRPGFHISIRMEFFFRCFLLSSILAFPSSCLSLKLQTSCKTCPTICLVGLEYIHGLCLEIICYYFHGS